MQINLFTCIYIEVSEMCGVLPVMSCDTKIPCFDFALVTLLKKILINNFKIISHVRKLFTTQLIITQISLFPLSNYVL